MLDKNTNIRHFKTTVVYIFSKYVHCDMRFLDVKIGIVANMKHASTYSPVAFRSVHTGIKPPFFIKNILCDYCLHDSGLYIQKKMTKREMINCKKFNLLLFLTLNSVTTGVRELNGTSQISLVTHDAKGEMLEI